MTEIFNVVTSGEALRKVFGAMRYRPGSEKVDIGAALGRVLSEDLRAPENLPAFQRSVMDGFAVRAKDTFGASESVPAYLKVAGEVPMGRAATCGVATGEALKIHTGGMLPPGADAVVMVENTQAIGEPNIEVTRPVAVGENVLQVGEDVRQNDVVLKAGHRLRPQDVGGLAALGLTSIGVCRRPKLGVISSGDEVVPADSVPGAGQVRDVNSHVLSGLALDLGVEPVGFGIVPDLFDLIRSALASAIRECDAVVISAGSSVSTRDMTARAINDLGKPGVIAHGLSIKPGKPTVVAVIDGKPVFGLPGNPVSATVIFMVAVKPVLLKLAGLVDLPSPRAVMARLTHNIASAPGREDYVPVRLSEVGGEVTAEPIFGKSNLIYTLVKASGLVRVPLDSSGIVAGQEVSVELF